MAHHPCALTSPDWDFLFDMALLQAGLFTAKQATFAGHSPQLLQHYLHIGKIVRMRHGIYRIVHFPPESCERLVCLWLWSEEAAVASHRTALALHGLCDPVQNEVHLTVPPGWRRRRRRVPEGVVLHYADVPRIDLTLGGPVPITSPQRTLNDCVQGGVVLPVIVQALQRAIAQGLHLPRQGRV